MSTSRRVNGGILASLGLLFLAVAIFVSPLGEAVEPGNYPRGERSVFVLMAVGCLGFAGVLFGRHRLGVNAIAFMAGTAATALGTVASLDYIPAKGGLFTLAVIAFLVALLKPAKGNGR